MSDDDLYGDTLAPGEFEATADFPASSFGPRYQVIEELGRGGMGTVYRAFDTELREDIALKALLPTLAQDRRALLRFRHEVRIARRVSHPNIARIHDFHVHDDTPFLTMEFVPGVGLDTILSDSGSFSAEQMLGYMIPVLNALEAAHQAGVVHRDLKPANVMVSEDGRVVVTDFGIATMVGDVSDEGQIVGTPLYLSPEQARAQSVDSRSDLYTAGVMMHVMLTGASPWDATDAMTLIMARLLKPPRPLPVDTPDFIQTAICALMQIDPRDRPESANEVVQALSDPTHAAAPSRSLSPLPNHFGKFVGREADLDVVHSNLEAHGCVVVCGPGGIGKTRLAVEYSQQRNIPVAWVSLDGVVTVDEAMSRIVDKLGLPASAGIQEISAQLDALDAVLWVLDSVDRLDVTALAEPFLGMGCEVVMTQRGRSSDFPSVQLEPLSADAAQALFLDRATSRTASIDQSEPGFVEVIEQLEGYPLALELAASRLGIMTLETLSQRLRDPIRTLRNKDLGSIESAITDSWDELTSDLQSALAQFSVFEGGASLDDVCEILACDGYPEDLLEELVDRSLIRWMRGDGRFTCFEVIRDFAKARLPDVCVAATSRHQKYFEQRMTVSELQHSDLMNARAAFLHSVAVADHSSAEKLLGGIWYILERRGPYSMGQQLSEQLLNITDSNIANNTKGFSLWRQGELENAAVAFETSLSQKESSDAFMGLGQVRWSQGRFDESEQLLKRAIAGTGHTRANSINVLGLVEWSRGNLDLAREYLKTAAQEYEVYIPSKQGIALSNLALVEDDQDDTLAAIATTRLAIDLLKVADDQRSVALAQSNLGNMLRKAGQLDEAESILRVAIDANSKLGDRRMMGFAKNNLAMVLAEQGHHREAVPLLEEAIKHFETLHEPAAIDSARNQLQISKNFLT